MIFFINSKFKIQNLKLPFLLAVWLLIAPFCAFAGVSANVSASANASTDAADDLTRLLSGLNSMSADFDQVTSSKKNQVSQQITGQMALQKPGKFRWQTEQPIQQLIIANNGYVWIYDADLEQVTKQKIDYQQPGNPAMLLSGSLTTLRKTFSVRNIDQKEDDSWFELRPKAANNLYQWIRLHFIDNKLADMQMADNLGQQNTFHFKNVVMNPSLSPSKFIFVAPKGVDIIGE